ncbi:MAG: leucine-rich repeat domain-containing protein [Oscillospiraceae bacterium]|nr:leucine-rich repeat domain-containing protein [Oscillospiraceae bacterium]
MRKKLLALVLALAMVVSLMVVPVSADTTTGTYGYLTYEIEDGAVTITDCDGSASGELVIPDTIEGYPETSIGDYAFYYCYNLTEVSLPSGITSIGSYAFFCCFGLSELPLSSGITSIGVAAFSGTAYASNEDNWIDSVLYIGEYLIDYSGSGTCIMRDGTTLIAGGAFAWDDGALTAIVLPDSLLYIGERAFEDCAGLTEIMIPASVRVIGESAFNYCIGLTAITLEGSDFTTGAFTFYGCRNVTTLTVNGTMDISWSFLDELTGLTTVVYNRE